MSGRNASVYLYQSLYSFTAATRAAITSRFLSEIQNADTTLVYDTSCDQFTINCPAVVGPAADAVLRKIIDEYIDAEEELAAQTLPTSYLDEQRTAAVIRFPQSTFDAVDTVGAPEHHASMLPKALANFLETKPPVHIIITPDREAQQVLFFQLVELNEFGLFDRVITPNDKRRYYPLLANGFTCRSARHDSKRSWTFNGRTGTRPKPVEDLHSVLQLPAFHTLLDTRTGLDEVEHEAPTWEFVGQPTTVEKWMGGVGEVQMIDPNTKPDLPKETRKHQAQEEMHCGGRPRVPKGFNLEGFESDDPDDDFEAAPAPKGSSFAALLSLGSGDRSEAEPGDFETSVSTCDEKSDDYGNHYARVDNVGLTSNAANAARWDLEHDELSATQRQGKIKSKPLIPRLLSSSASSPKVSSSNPGSSATSAANKPRLELKRSNKITTANHDFGALLAQLMLEKDDDDDDDDEDAQSLPVKLVAQLGILLSVPDEQWFKFSRDPASPIELQSILRQNAQHLKTCLISRLTTSTADAMRLINIAIGQGFRTGNSTAVASYDILIQDSSGSQLKVSMLASDKTSFYITARDQLIGKAFCHFPMHVWDAQFSLVQPGGDVKSESEQAICEFIASMATDQEEPSFHAMIPSGAFLVQAVLAKQTVTCEIDGITLEVIRYQQLVLERLKGRIHNFRAFAHPDEEMVNGQLLWWEARLVTEDLRKADQMQTEVNDLVAAVDGIGLQNRCMWMWNESHLDEELAMVAPEAPFW